MTNHRCEQITKCVNQANNPLLCKEGVPRIPTNSLTPSMTSRITRSLAPVLLTFSSLFQLPADLIEADAAFYEQNEQVVQQVRGFG